MRYFSIFLFMFFAFTASTQSIVQGVSATGEIDVSQSSLALTFFDSPEPLTLTFTKVYFDERLNRSVGLYKQVVIAQWDDCGQIVLVNGVDGFLISGYDRCTASGGTESRCAEVWRQTQQ